jgi:hypothetical protein
MSHGFYLVILFALEKNLPIVAIAIRHAMIVFIIGMSRISTIQNFDSCLPLKEMYVIDNKQYRKLITYMLINVCAMFGILYISLFCMFSPYLVAFGGTVVSEQFHIVWYGFLSMDQSTNM